MVPIATATWMEFRLVFSVGFHVDVACLRTRASDGALLFVPSDLLVGGICERNISRFFSPTSGIRVSPWGIHNLSCGPGTIAKKKNPIIDLIHRINHQSFCWKSSLEEEGKALFDTFRMELVCGDCIPPLIIIVNLHSHIPARRAQPTQHFEWANVKCRFEKGSIMTMNLTRNFLSLLQLCEISE